MKSSVTEPRRPPYLLGLLLVVLLVLLATRRPSGLVWSAAAGEAFRYAPLVTRGLLVAGSEDGQLQGLRAADGRALWELRLHAPLSCPPVAAGERIVAGTREGRLIALNRLGQVVWRVQVSSGAVAEVVAAGSRLGVRTDPGELWCFDLNGKARWRLRPAPPPTGLAALPSGRFVVTYADGRAEVRGPDGRRRWAATFAGAPLRWPVVLDPWIYVATDEARVLKINSTNGRLLQSVRFGAPLAASPTASGDWFWAVSTAGTLSGVSSRGQIWEARLRTAATAPPVVMETRLAVPCLDGRLRIVDAADGGRPRGLDLAADVTAAMVAAEGRLYVATWSGQLLCLALP